MTASTFKPSASSERFNDIWCAFVNVFMETAEKIPSVYA